MDGVYDQISSDTNLQANTAYAPDAEQTLAIEDDESRLHQYAAQVKKLAPRLQQPGIKYLATDSYYSKENFITSVTGAGIQIVGKLRNDANLKWLCSEAYTGAYSGKGRPRKYGGKVYFDDEVSQFKKEGEPKSGEQIYSAVVYAPAFKNCYVATSKK